MVIDDVARTGWSSALMKHLLKKQELVSITTRVLRFCVCYAIYVGDKRAFVRQKSKIEGVCIT